MKNFEFSNSSDLRRLFILKIIFLAFSLLFAFAGKIFSQDIIIKKDKSEIKAKVIEIQEASIIKYKPFEFLDGPLRSILVSDVSSIKYENGNTETFTLVSTNSIPLSINQSFQNQPSQENSNVSYYPLRAFARFSFQHWNNSEISDIYGNNVLLGVGIEKQLSDDFKIGADLDYGPSKYEDYTIYYTQVGGFLKYSWRPFGSNLPNVCGGLGVKGIFLKESVDNEIEKGSSVGFSALLGIEIPLGKKTILDLGWNTVWSTMDYLDSKLNVGSEIFHCGLIFNLW